MLLYLGLATLNLLDRISLHFPLRSEPYLSLSRVARESLR